MAFKQVFFNFKKGNEWFYFVWLSLVHIVRTGLYKKLPCRPATSVEGSSLAILSECTVELD